MYSTIYEIRVYSYYHVSNLFLPSSLNGVEKCVGLSSIKGVFPDIQVGLFTLDGTYCRDITYNAYRCAVIVVFLLWFIC
jgi:hypothetical protein